MGNTPGKNSIGEKSNPFFHRGPVRDPAYFFGRKEEVRYLFDLLLRGQSVSVSGPRRFGKTSLLFNAADPGIMRQYGLDPQRIRWVYLEGGMLDGLDEEWLYGAIDRGLGNDANTLPYTGLLERLRGLSEQGLRLIIALDEFELFASNPQFQPSMFNRLRGLAGQFAVSFVVASKEPLARLSFAHPETLSSPFFNIFAPTPLGLLPEQEAIEMLTSLSARGGQTFKPRTNLFLLDLVGPHPFFLQVAGYRAFAAQDRGLLSSDACAAVREQVGNDLEGHLNYYWFGISLADQYALASLPVMALDSRSSAFTRLTEAGLLRKNGYLGTVLRDFVSRQRIDGLLQCGRFVMDERRKLVAANGQSVHLTPTEFEALRLLLQNPGQLLTPEDIEAALWPGEIAPDPERARGIVKRLRSALGQAGEAIVTVRGQGYVLNLK